MTGNDLQYYYFTDEWGGWALVKAYDEAAARELFTGRFFFDGEAAGFDAELMAEEDALAMLRDLEVPSYTRFSEAWDALVRFRSCESGVIFGEAE